LGHTSSKKIRALATNGILPRRVAKYRILMCTSCLQGISTRQPRRTKTAGMRARLFTRRLFARSPSQETASPSISLSQRLKDFIDQIKGKPTVKRHHAATVFVNHYSDQSNAHFYKSTDATILPKDAFQRYTGTVSQ
jgi:hypothetical protein